MDDHSPRRVVHHRGSDGVGGDHDEVGGGADGEASSVVVDDVDRRPRAAVDDRPASAGGGVDAALDELVAPVAGPVRQLPRPLEDVAVAVRRPVVTDPVLAEPDAHPGRAQGLQRQRFTRAGRDSRDGDVVGGEQVDQRRLPACVDGREGEGMADRDAAGHPTGGDPLGDQLERERTELAGLMEVDVDADLVAFGEPEHGVEVSDRVAVEGARVDAADEVGTGADGRVEEVGGAPIAEDA